MNCHINHNPSTWNKRLQGRLWLSGLIFLTGVWFLSANLAMTATEIEKKCDHAQENPCLRSSIQSALSQPGDFTRTIAWQDQFQGKHLHCSGTVTHVIETPVLHRLEVMLRVLPDTRLYDTVLLLEHSAYTHDSRQWPQAGQTLSFHGPIVRGIDLFGLKQVFVQISSPTALRLEKPNLETSRLATSSLNKSSAIEGRK